MLVTLRFLMAHRWLYQSPYYNKYITNKGIMSTNSRIGLRLADGSILSVYHHWDGYPQWLGVTLNKYYPTRESIAELIDGGNMSCCYTQSGWEIEDEEKLKGLPYKPLYYTERGSQWKKMLPKLHKTILTF